MRHILRVVYEKISPMMKTSGKGNYSRWPYVISPAETPGKVVCAKVYRHVKGIKDF